MICLSDKRLNDNKLQYAKEYINRAIILKDDLMIEERGHYCAFALKGMTSPDDRPMGPCIICGRIGPDSIFLYL